MANKAQQPKLTTPEFRVSFPSLFEARAAEEGQKAKYSVAMIFRKTDPALAKLRAAIDKAGRDHFGGAWESVKHMKPTIRDGAEKEKLDGYGPTVVFASASSMRRPGVVGPDLAPILDASDIYAGCFGRATLVPYAYDKKGNKGVALGLRNFQKLRDGDRLDGGTPPEDDFNAVEAEPAAGSEDFSDMM